MEDKSSWSQPEFEREHGITDRSMGTTDPRNGQKEWDGRP